MPLFLIFQWDACDIRKQTSSHEIQLPNEQKTNDHIWPDHTRNLNKTLGAAIEHTNYKTDKLFINSVYYRNSRVMKTSLDKEVVLGERRGWGAPDSHTLVRQLDDGFRVNGYN